MPSVLRGARRRERSRASRCRAAAAADARRAPRDRCGSRSRRRAGRWQEREIGEHRVGRRLGGRAPARRAAARRARARPTAHGVATARGATAVCVQASCDRDESLVHAVVVAAALADHEAAAVRLDRDARRLAPAGDLGGEIERDGFGRPAPVAPLRTPRLAVQRLVRALRVRDRREREAERARQHARPVQRSRRREGEPAAVAVEGAGERGVGAEQLAREASSDRRLPARAAANGLPRATSSVRAVGTPRDRRDPLRAAVREHAGRAEQHPAVARADRRGDDVVAARAAPRPGDHHRTGTEDGRLVGPDREGETPAGIELRRALRGGEIQIGVVGMAPGGVAIGLRRRARRRSEMTDGCTLLPGSPQVHAGHGAARAIEAMDLAAPAVGVRTAASNQSCAPSGESDGLRAALLEHRDAARLAAAHRQRARHDRRRRSRRAPTRSARSARARARAAPRRSRRARARRRSRRRATPTARSFQRIQPPAGPSARVADEERDRERRDDERRRTPTVPATSRRTRRPRRARRPSRSRSRRRGGDRARTRRRGRAPAASRASRAARRRRARPRPGAAARGRAAPPARSRRRREVPRRTPRSARAIASPRTVRNGRRS